MTDPCSQQWNFSELRCRAYDLTQNFGLRSGIAQCKHVVTNFSMPLRKSHFWVKWYARCFHSRDLLGWRHGLVPGGHCGEAEPRDCFRVAKLLTPTKDVSSGSSNVTITDDTKSVVVCLCPLLPQFWVAVYFALAYDILTFPYPEQVHNTPCVKCKSSVNFPLKKVKWACQTCIRIFTTFARTPTNGIVNVSSWKRGCCEAVKVKKRGVAQVISLAARKMRGFPMNGTIWECWNV